MSRIHGRRGVIYMDLTGVGSASPIAYVKKWSLSAATDKSDVTAMGDSNKIYVSGIPDASGDFDFWYDDASVQTYTAATDGLPRKTYIYPNALTPGQYWWGTVLPDFQVSAAVDGAVEGSASWNAASTISKVG